VTTILYLTNSELFGRSTASSQYFLQLASYLGIPVIAWNADNSGLERRVSGNIGVGVGRGVQVQAKWVMGVV
jgi:hypothetical protein